MKCTCIPAFNKILLHKNLANFPSSVFFKTRIQLQVYRQQWLSLKATSYMAINVSCVMPFICVTLKTTLRCNSQEGHFCHRTVLFPVIRRYCSADVKMLVFLLLLPHTNRRRCQNMSLICQVANTRAHENIYSPDLFISGTPGHPNMQCRFCGLFLSCRKRYIDREFDIKFRAN